MQSLSAASSRWIYLFLSVIVVVLLKRQFIDSAAPGLPKKEEADHA